MYNLIMKNINDECLILSGKERVLMDAVMRKEDFYTLADIYALPDGERAELVDGRIYNMAPPGRTHQRLVKELTYQVEDYIRKNHGACELFQAPFGVFLNEDDQNYLKPDLCVICDPSKTDEKGCHGAPDWIIEVVSPGSKEMDYFTKLFKYQMSGVREYWIVDAMKRRITVYHFEQKQTEEYAFGEDIPVGIYEGFMIHMPETV